MPYKPTLKLLFIILILFSLKFCCSKEDHLIVYAQVRINAETIQKKDTLKRVIVDRNITIKNYFNYIDSLVQHYNSLTSYTLSEHLLIRYNPWVIDTLQNTDYYRMMARDSFVFNQKEMIVLNEGSTLIIPDSINANALLKAFSNTEIDINIPEYKLRIFEDTVQLYAFPIRVGRNEKKYLEMAGRVEDLRTKTGKGTIVAHVKNPDYFNPVNGKQYFVTKRDDNKTTELPQIPFIETEINGLRYGQLIHSTTNPITLEKAYSNGCIGIKEADAWLIYYYSRIGTAITIRYQLNILNEKGEKTVLKDIYNYY